MRAATARRLLLILAASACTGPPNDVFDPCLSNGLDSVMADDGTAIRIRSEAQGCASYSNIAWVRHSRDANAVSIDYMVHAAVGNEKAILVLIGGGALNSKIEDADNDGVPDRAGGNFVLRSAHLFADQGYRVITIDRPSDFLDFMVGQSPWSDFDSYRTSMAHAVDLSTVINAEDPGQQPVFVAGTSRGAVSAVASASLFSAIALSSPVTSGSGSPISETSSNPAVRPSRVTGPVHILWHPKDTCPNTSPVAAAQLVAEFTRTPVAATGDFVEGGFISPLHTECEGLTHHGFLGVETTAVNTATGWMDAVLDQRQASPPSASAHRVPNTVRAGDSPITINLAGLVVEPNPNTRLSFASPYAKATLGGRITVDAQTGEALYTPPALVAANAVDSFVYTVTNDSGAIAHNVVLVPLSP